MVGLGKEGEVPYHEHDDQDIRLALAQALHEADTEADKRAKRTFIAQLLAYVLIVGVAVFVSWRQEGLSDDLCTGAAENREALRAIVVGVGDLGEALIIGDAAGDDYISPQQAEALTRINEFEKQQLKTLELPICER